jgi:crossover junction endodeoxyribonuclease RusA
VGEVSAFGGGEMTYACLVLPFPPSLNSIIACMGKRRVKTAAHTQYMIKASRAIKQQPCARFTDPVSVVASFGRPNKRRRDIDNFFKAVGDALQANEVLEDDYLIHKSTLQWVDDVVGVRVEIETLED